MTSSSSSSSIRSTSRLWMPSMRNVHDRFQNAWQWCWPLYQLTTTATTAVANLRSRTDRTSEMAAHRTSSTTLPVQTNQRLENYLHLIYLIFSWQQPMLTLTLCAIFHLLFILTLIMDRSLLGSLYWLLFLVSISDAFIEAIVFNRRFLDNHPLRPPVAAIVQNLSAQFSKAVVHIQQLYMTKPESVFAYALFGVFVAIFLFITLSNLINLYLFAMVLFFGPISLVQYSPNLVDTLFKSIVFMTSQTISEEELAISQISESDRDCDNDSQASDFSTESYITSLLKNVQHMPSHLEVDEDDDDNELDPDIGEETDGVSAVVRPDGEIDLKKSPVDYVSEFSRNLMSKIWKESMRMTTNTSQQLVTVTEVDEKETETENEVKEDDEEPNILQSNDSNGCDSDDYEIISPEEINLVQ